MNDRRFEIGGELSLRAGNEFGGLEEQPTAFQPVERRNHIRHLITGGTIDSTWHPEMDTASPASESTSANYLDWLVECGAPRTEHHLLMMKDSRETTLQDRDLVAASIAEASSTRLMVTSGTFLMPDMAREAASHNMAKFFEGQGKRVVFTGALTPIHGFEMSDGGFNLGMATALLTTDALPSATTVLATMNGMAVPGDKLRKDLTTATFSGSSRSDDLLGYETFTVVPAGGTMDFELDGMDGLRPASESIIPGYLRESVRIAKRFEASKPILKDSRALTSADMDMVVDIIRSSTDEHILVSSGLYRMSKLRERISAGLGKEVAERRIILTGSKYLLKMAGMTDAPFNLGFALGNLGLVERGVHIAVGGAILKPDQDPVEHTYTKTEQQAMSLGN